MVVKDQTLLGSTLYLEVEKMRFIYQATVTLFILATVFMGENGFGYEFPNKTKPLTSENTFKLSAISAGVSDIAAAANGALVFISVSKIVKGSRMGAVDPFEFFFGVPRQQVPNRHQEMPKQEGLGSGFILDLNKGYIMTNNHVIAGADEIEVKLANGEAYKAKVVGNDQNTDIAVVQITSNKFKKEGLAELSFADSDKVKVGDFVVALGAPFGLEASVSFGVVSAMGRGNLGITSLGNFIQTDAAINPGNSGGPLLNTRGQVIGVNSAIYSKSGGYNGIGFAIPANLTKMVGERLVNDGKISRGFIGVSLQGLSAELIETLGLPEKTSGALVSNVLEKGPAAKSGIREGDVISRVNGKTVKNPSDIANEVGLLAPGKKVEIEIFRDGKKQMIDVKLGEFPNAPSNNRSLQNSNASFGLSLAPLDINAKQQQNIESDNGLLVMGIEKNSVAADSDLKVGDLIISVNGKNVTNVSDFKKYIRSKGRNLLRIERSGQFFFVSLRKK